MHTCKSQLHIQTFLKAFITGPYTLTLFTSNPSIKIQQISTSESEGSSKQNTVNSPLEQFELPPTMAEMTAAKLLEFLKKAEINKKGSSFGTKSETGKNKTPTKVAEEPVEATPVSPKPISEENSKSSSPKPKTNKGKEKVTTSLEVELLGETGRSPTPLVPHRRTRSSSLMKTPAPVENAEKMELVAKRKIAYGMVIDFSKDETMKRIEKKFAKIGWENFFKVTEEVIFDSLVRQFYGNLSYSVHGTSVHVSSVVDGHAFTLSEKILGSILGVPPAGRRVFCTNRWDKKSTGVDFGQAMEIIANFPVDPLWFPKPSLEFTNQLTRTMARIIKMAIMPKLGNLSGQNYNEMHILFYLKMKAPLNLPYLILNHMIESAKDSRGQSVLPYRMILTRIFKHFTEINTAAYPFSPMPRNNVIRKPIVFKKGPLKRKAVLSPSSQDKKQKVSHSETSGQKSEPPLSDQVHGLEYLLRCALSRIDTLQEEMKTVKQKVRDLKAKYNAGKSDSEGSENENVSEADDEEEEMADESEED
ncbi:hypothetical protein L6164_013350 [Bauhinia variegata]|uniref:Uncharacterized protein n=1 Tax=Bauhinia variegata TaxID=167791 RepID=A0ACB9PC28_BAUVA|nr:hypothetical protein L6164_013350 [Bauhinia variegata]